MTELVLPKPLIHQQAPLLADSSRKVWNWGRRAGKSRGSYVAATVGHGPGSTWGAGHDPKYPGILQGVDVIWLARDYPQALTIWQEEIRPRFAGRDGITLNEQTRQVRVSQSGGMLEVRSAEAVDGIRGRGGRLGGVILDEAAHWDLEYGWKSVILPALLDNNGWAIFNSSPNAGYDGNKQRLTPSYFNRLCREVLNQTRERGGWEYSHRTAEDNPTITAEAFKALISEYPADSPQLAQEVYAKLLATGAGLAFPEWHSGIHTMRGEISPNWRWFGGMDWGYRSPGCFLLMASGPDREVWVRGEFYFREQTPVQVGEAMGVMLRRAPYQVPEWIAGDVAMWGVNDGISIAEDVQRGLRNVMGQQAPGLVPAPTGKGSRLAGWSIVHEALRYDPANLVDGKLAPFHMPRLRVHPDCTNLIRTLPSLPRDEKNPEDVDTQAEDHAADALRYALTTGQLEADHREQLFDRNRSRGWHPDGTAKRPDVPGYDEEHSDMLAEEASGKFLTGVRWE